MNGVWGNMLDFMHNDSPGDRIEKVRNALVIWKLVHCFCQLSNDSSYDKFCFENGRRTMQIQIENTIFHYKGLSSFRFWIENFSKLENFWLFLS